MYSKRNLMPSHRSLGLILWTLLFSGLSRGLESDVNCLKSIKASLEDPFRYLESSWNFENKTEGYICDFPGVECWHPGENKVLNIRLSDMGLKGPFPSGIAGCSSLTGLDLSYNKLFGPIPEDISRLVGYKTSLDLSSNNFSGRIPRLLLNCTYLNVLKLDHNRLSGTIPPELAFLSRIAIFSVSNNRLSGPVPAFNESVVGAESYANNAGLCGGPLPDCGAPQRRSRTVVVVASAVGGVTFAALATGVGLAFFFRRVAMRRKKELDPDGNKWARIIKGTKAIKVSMFEKSVNKMSLSDLMKATNNFSKDNIIGSGRTGTLYKATLDNGSFLTVKRLQESQHSEKEFSSEMATLGSVRHRNLVPLVGFCVAKKERLVVYKYMPEGNLWARLNPPEEEVGSEPKKGLDWETRLRIGVGAARGFAWLHHSCNPRIIHRNVSSKCILLDTGFEPMISDFGLARLMNPIDTHLSTFVNGEFGDLGYVAPEYARTLVTTPKGDVYGFGVVLLELATGEMPTRVSRAHEGFNGSLAEWVAGLAKASDLRSAIDESLLGNGVDSEVFQFLKVACSCVAPEPKERPTMFEVYQLLRAVGEKYVFTADDDMTMPSETGETNVLEELIVAREK